MPAGMQAHPGTAPSPGSARLQVQVQAGVGGGKGRRWLNTQQNEVLSLLCWVVQIDMPTKSNAQGCSQPDITAAKQGQLRLAAAGSGLTLV
jgi:hypothetical protein